MTITLQLAELEALLERRALLLVNPNHIATLITIARAALALDRAKILEVLEESFDEYGLHTGGSYGVEFDHNEKTEMLKSVADRLVALLVAP